MPDWELELHLLQLRPSAAKKKKKKSGKGIGSVDQRSWWYITGTKLDR